MRNLLLAAASLLVMSAAAHAQCVGQGGINTIDTCAQAVSPQQGDELLVYQPNQTPHTRKMSLSTLMGVMAGTANTWSGAQAFSAAATFGNAPPPGSAGSVMIRVPSTFGTYSTATGLAVMANQPVYQPAVSGFTTPSQASSYQGRDSVALFASNSDRAPLYTLTGGTYDATHYYPSPALTAAQVAAIRVGVWVETNDNPKFSGQVTAVSSSAITVGGGWYQIGNAAAGQIPAGSTAYIDVMTSPDAANFVCSYAGYYPNGIGCAGLEVDILNNATPLVLGNLYTTVGDTPRSSALLIENGGTYHAGAALEINGDFERGIIIRNADTAGFIYGKNSGTGFLSSQTSGNVFEIRDRTTDITTTALVPGSIINLGKQTGGTGNVPVINFYSSANGNPDALIRTEGGSASSFNGVLRAFASRFEVYSPSQTSGDWFSITAGASGSGSTLRAAGSGNSPLTIRSNGTSTISLTAFQASTDAKVAVFTPPTITASNQTNFLTVGASLTGNAVTIGASGVDANAAITLAAAGTGTTTIGSATSPVNFPGAVKANGTAGVTCSGAPTASFASTNGIVTHC